LLDLHHLICPCPLDLYVFKAVISTICAPLVEETFFRGAVLTWLSQKMPVIAALFLSSAIFSLLHLKMIGTPGAEGWLLTVFAFALGFANGALAIGTRSLWPGIVAYAGMNGLTLLMIRMGAYS
jgi:uncharacterized protein